MAHSAQRCSKLRSVGLAMSRTVLFYVQFEGIGEQPAYQKRQGEEFEI